MVHEPVPGKGEAMRAGVAAAPASDVIVFLDADLVGPAPRITSTASSPPSSTGDADMACGLFDRGPLANPPLPPPPARPHGPAGPAPLAVRQLDDDDLRGYRVEAALNSLVGAAWPRAARPRSSPGLWHRTKQEKLGSPVVGHATKLAMLSQRLLELRALRRGAPRACSPPADPPWRRASAPARHSAHGRSRGSS